MALEAVRLSLINSMYKCLCRHPFPKITIQDICDKASVSRRTFYNYYHDKYSLLSDTYHELFFSQIEIDSEDSSWEVFRKICHQFYDDKVFFSRVIDIKEQNGFWDELTRTLGSYIARDCPIVKEMEREAEIFIGADVMMMLTMIEDWMKDGMKQDPEEFAGHVRAAFSVYGLWTYQIAANIPRKKFSGQYDKEVSWFGKEER